jgi:antitoxin YefM
MHIVSFTQARSEFKSVIDRVVADCDDTLIHRRDGENAVLLAKSTYNSMLETLHLLQAPANARRLMAAAAQDRKGAAKARALIEE